MTDEKPPAELVAGKYKLTRLLGRGGMGSVWEGIHASLGSRVACKFIEPEYVDSVDAVTRFENEARAAASLKSKHVVDVYDHGVMPDGRPYIVMEFLEGEPLDKRIEKLGTLNMQQVATIVLQVSRALSRAHRVGIVHRDLKPENVFLVWDDEDQTDVAKVVDFGIAKFTDAKSSGISSATKTGSILGTPYYMSPEQARGLKNLDARSDNWSLAVIAYEALTGARPFDGEAVGDLLVRICTTDPTPPSQINPSLPPALDDWVVRALNRDPNARFQDVTEMAEQLITVAGLPGRRTLGSALSTDDITGVDDPRRATVAAATQGLGSPKATSGALTHAALEQEVASPPLKKSNPLVLAAAAAGVLILVGGAFVMGGGDGTGEPASDSTALEEKGSSANAKIEEFADPNAKNAASPDVEALSPPTAAPPPPPEPIAEPAPAPIQPKPAVQSKPVQPKPAAQPKPQPVQAPPPRPAPAPKPQSGGLDLGY